MLILTRKPGDRIIVETSHGELITIEVKEIRGKQKVRVGIIAPRTMNIYRHEIFEQSNEDTKLDLVGS